MKKLVFETIGLFLFFTIMVFIVGSLTSCNHIKTDSQTEGLLNDDRFCVNEGITTRSDFIIETIYVDTETGVQYLWVCTGYAGGLTVLVDRDGKPLIAEGY